MDSDRLSHARLWTVHHRGVARRATSRGAGIDFGLARHVVLHHEHGPRIRRQSGGPPRGGRHLPPACSSRRTRRSTVARVSERASVGRFACGERARSRRSRSLVQRARGADRVERRRPSQRSRQPVQRHGTHRARGTRGADAARHPHWQYRQRDTGRQRRCHVPGLDEPRRRPRHGGTPQPQRGRPRRFVELRSSVARLFAGGAARVARRRTALLLRRRQTNPAAAPRSVEHAALGAPVRRTPARPRPP